jgi:hypothetical protein
MLDQSPYIPSTGRSAAPPHPFSSGRRVPDGPPGASIVQDLWLSYRECLQIAKTVFGSEQDPMCREFMHIIESQLVGRKRSGAAGQVSAT